MFNLVKDEGVRNYLNAPATMDYNVVAEQLNAAYTLLKKEGQLSVHNIENAYTHYDLACEYFGLRDLTLVHDMLRLFWAGVVYKGDVQ